jgi:hypothetical protein
VRPSKPAISSAPDHHQPNVHILFNSLVDYAQHGTRPRVDKLAGGGSFNMQLGLAVLARFADPTTGTQPLIDALDWQQQNQYLGWPAGQCEQGIAAPHIEYILTALATALLDAIRLGHTHSTELSTRIVLLLSQMYALSIPTTTPGPRFRVLGPGARMSEMGPASDALDACMGVIAGRVHKTPFRNLGGDTAGPWALLEALTIDPHLFDAARGWTIDDCAEHWPSRLRWPVRVETCENGHRAVLLGSSEVLAADRALGKVGSGGIGVDAVTVQYSPLRFAWLPVGSGKWEGDQEADPGAVARTIARG